MVLENSYEKRVENIRKSLENFLSIVVFNSHGVFVFILYGRDAFKIRSIRNNTLTYLNYGCIQVEVFDVHDAIYSFIHEFIETLSERDLNGKVLTEFISSYKRSYLLNFRSLKGLAVESMVIFIDEQNRVVDLKFVDFEGNIPSINCDLNKLPAFHIFGAYGNNRIGEIKIFLNHLKSSGRLSAHPDKFIQSILDKLKEWASDDLFKISVLKYNFE